jgi:hypothetical protein
MKTKTPIAAEQITISQGIDLLKAYVDSRAQVKDGEEHYFKYVRESGVLESLLKVLIIDNPTKVCEVLNLIEVRHEIHEIKGLDLETEFVESLFNYEVAKCSLEILKLKNPGKEYRIVTKMYKNL